MPNAIKIKHVCECGEILETLFYSTNYEITFTVPNCPVCIANLEETERLQETVENLEKDVDYYEHNYAVADAKVEDLQEELNSTISDLENEIEELKEQLIQIDRDLHIT